MSGLVAGRFQAAHQFLGQDRPADRGETPDLLERQDGHDARNDRDRDPGRPAAIDEAVVERIVEEQLGGDESGARVHLVPQMGQVCLGGRGFRMLFRIAGHAQAEIGMARLEQSHELVGMPQPVGGRLELGGALRRIAAQRHDVPKAAGVDPIGNLVQLGPGMADAGQVGHHGEAEILAEQIAHLGGPAAGVAARPVGDRDEIRRDSLQGRGGQAQGFDPRVILWREKLERTQRADWPRRVRRWVGPPASYQHINK